MLPTTPAGEELAQAIRTVAGGGTAVDSKLAAAAITEGESPLTQREHDVLVASGATTPRPTSPSCSTCRKESCGTT